MLFEIYFATVTSDSLAINRIAVVLVLYYLLLTSLCNKLGVYSTIDPQRYHLLPNWFTQQHYQLIPNLVVFVEGC
jgi:hypothetical protein